jgi:hypothetical protein
MDCLRHISAFVDGTVRMPGLHAFAFSVESWSCSKLRAHILVAEHTWAQEERSHGDNDYLSLESLHSGVRALVEVEALEEAVGVHVSRPAFQGSCDAPCVDAHRLEQTPAGIDLVALGLLEFAACVKNQQSKTSLWAPWWYARMVVLIVLVTL